MQEGSHYKKIDNLLINIFDWSVKYIIIVIRELSSKPIMGRSPTNIKARLIETANDLIWKSSYGSVSVDDICNASGVKKGSFYYYFHSKVELATVVMEESYQYFESELHSVFSSSVPPVKRFENLADFSYEKQKKAYDKYGHACGCPFASLGSEMAGNEEIIQKKVDEIFARQKSLFIITLQEMVDTGLLPRETDVSVKAAELLAFIMGQLMMVRIQNNLTTLKEDMRLGLFRILALETMPDD